MSVDLVRQGDAGMSATSVQFGQNSVDLTKDYASTAAHLATLAKNNQDSAAGFLTLYVEQLAVGSRSVRDAYDLALLNIGAALYGAILGGPNITKEQSSAHPGLREVFKRVENEICPARPWEKTQVPDETDTGITPAKMAMRLG